MISSHGLVKKTGKTPAAEIENSLTDARFATIMKVFRALNAKISFNVELLNQGAIIFFWPLEIIIWYVSTIKLLNSVFIALHRRSDPSSVPMTDIYKCLNIYILRTTP